MKTGVLGFSYKGFSGFKDQLDRTGHYTVNLGDNAQTIAARALLLKLGARAEDIVAIDRDTLSSYDGEPVALIMNGVFRGPEFPISPKVRPIFVGFHARPGVVEQNREWLKQHEPIGCRDIETAASLIANGIAAFTTGCITLTLPARTSSPPQAKLLVISGAGAGALPEGLLRFVPPALLDTAEFIHHRLPVGSYPLSARDRAFADRYEESVMAHYRDRATLVLTPLHHVAAPCIAMGIPVILARNDLDARFSFLQTLMPIHLPGSFEAIDWNPKPVEIGAVREALVEHVRQGLSRTRTALAS